MSPKNAAAAEAPEQNETEKGFGTGLRAKVAQKQDPAAAQAAQEPVAPPAVEAPPEPPVSFEEPHVSPLLEVAPEPVDQGPALESLRTELTAALARERDLQLTLQEQLERAERELDIERDFSMRLAEVDQRAAKLAARETELEERERRVAEQTSEEIGRAHV